MNRAGASGLGATVGELRTLIAKMPGDMPIVVRAPDGVRSAIVNAGVDTLDDEHSVEVLAIDVSDDADFVRTEDARRKA